MLVYTLKRLLQGVVTVWFIATATFFAMHFGAGRTHSPMRKRWRPKSGPNLQKRYGLDKPLLDPVLGLSRATWRRATSACPTPSRTVKVNDIIAEHFKVSATLGILAVIFAAFGGILWGALTAMYRNRAPDIVIVVILVILGISVPGFVFAAFGQLSLVKVNGWLGFTLFPVAGWGTVQHMIVPSMVLGLGTMAFLTRG